MFVPGNVQLIHFWFQSLLSPSTCCASSLSLFVKRRCHSPITCQVSGPQGRMGLPPKDCSETRSLRLDSPRGRSCLIVLINLRWTAACSAAQQVPMLTQDPSLRFSTSARCLRHVRYSFTSSHWGCYVLNKRQGTQPTNANSFNPVHTGFILKVSVKSVFISCHWRCQCLRRWKESNLEMLATYLSVLNVCYVGEVSRAGPLSGLVKWGSEGGCGRGTTESVEVSGGR